MYFYLIPDGNSYKGVIYDQLSDNNLVYYVKVSDTTKINEYYEKIKPHFDLKNTLDFTKLCDLLDFFAEYE